MSQQTVNFGATSVAEPPAPILPGDDADSSGADNRRKLMMVGAGVGVLVLALVAFFLLKGGGSSSSDNNGFVAPHHPANKSTTAAGAQQPVVKLPKRVVTPVGRDPFKPLYVAPVAALTGSQPTSGTTQSSTTGTTTTTTTGSTTSSTGTTSAASWAPVAIQLVSVNGTKTATFIVTYSSGSSSKTTTFSNIPAPTTALRTAFGKVFALLSIQDGTATVQYGDGSPFDIAPGAANRHPIG